MSPPPNAHPLNHNHNPKKRRYDRDSSLPFSSLSSSSSRPHKHSPPASFLSNLPALPPAPALPAHPMTGANSVQSSGALGAAGAGGAGAAGAGAAGGASGAGGGGGVSTTTSSGGGGGRHHSGSSAASKRPKRARSKSEKKEDNESPSRFHCDYCGRDLSCSVRARCAVCLDYDSCLDCFSVGAALKPHEADHAYRLIEVVHTPIFQADWSADEEEKLLEGLETFGIGNWEQVAKLIGSKNPIETEAHYLQVYLHGTHAPLPDPHHLQAPVELKKSSAAAAAELDDPKELRVMHKHQQEDAAGWMPKRQDFVYEWDNEAEEIIGDMDVSEEDTKADRERKQKILEIYCYKLDEREKRKAFVRERNLTDVKAHAAHDKKRSRDERDLREQLKVFMRLLPPDDFDRFVHGILEEAAVRARIDMLKHGRAAGAHSVDECQRLHAKHVKKELRLSQQNQHHHHPHQHQQHSHHGSNNASGVGSGIAAGQGAAGAGGAAGMATSSTHAGTSSAHSAPNMSSTSASATGAAVNSGANATGGGKSTGSGGGEASVVSGVSSQRRGRRGGGGSGGSGGGGVKGGGDGGGAGGAGGAGGDNMSDVQSAIGGGLNGANVYNPLNFFGHAPRHGHGAEQRRSVLHDIDPEMMAGSELLSGKELALCKSLDVIPHQYLIVKEVMIRESARNGYLRKKDVRAIIKLDTDKVFKIYAFLASCGWIRSGTSGGSNNNPGTSSASLAGNGIRSAVAPPSSAATATANNNNAHSSSNNNNNSGAGGGGGANSNINAGGPGATGSSRIGGGSANNANLTSNGSKSQSERT